MYIVCKKKFDILGKLLKVKENYYYHEKMLIASSMM